VVDDDSGEAPPVNRLLIASVQLPVGISRDVDRLRFTRLLAHLRFDQREVQWNPIEVIEGCFKRVVSERSNVAADLPLTAREFDRAIQSAMRDLGMSPRDVGLDDG
jgi:hypothetical protein